MEKKIEIPMIGIAILILAVVCHVSTADGEKRRTYIVHMAEFGQMQATLDVEEAQYFESSLSSVSSRARMLYKYTQAFHGYSASLTIKEVEALKARQEVISVFTETRYELHTTRTPWFLGLEQHADLLPIPQQLSNVIIGVFDTGVWPESKSFDDTGLPPIPDHWKGECETSTNFMESACNRKLVGARLFYRGYEAYLSGKVNESLESKSPRDTDGHGTHTSTTAAGSAVSDASLFGYANGTARGMASLARVAMYKTCWKGGCFSSDILAAMDKAIEDNVTVMSLSLGGGGNPFYSDNIAIGAFAAMDKGILVSCSAGNAGPSVSSLANEAPWITTVGASTLDRDFPTPITLGNKEKYTGVSLYSGKSLDGKFLPFVYAGNATDNITGNFCLPGTLVPEKVKGKIVLCDRGSNARAEKGFVVKDAGGAGMILTNTATNGEELVADAHLYLSTAVGQKAGQDMKKYLFSNLNPTVTILFQGTKLGVQPAPVVAAFSSRGPSTLVPEILKPDLIAPGVNILAGWTGDAGPSGIDTDTRRVPYNIISGTSMACPHVSGLAALLKAAHPNWSPAAIRSALMTTAYSTYKNGNPILDIATGNASTPFALGAGHVNPLAALNPGLVYDLNTTDYLNFLCASNYTDEQINAISRQKFTCNYNKSSYSVSNLNYPSFAVSIQANPKGNKAIVVKHIRTLTNVGLAGTYQVRIISQSVSVKIYVVPKTLTFNRTNEKKSYTVTFEVSPNEPANTSQFARIEWSDQEKKHVVGSPIAVTWTI